MSEGDGETIAKLGARLREGARRGAERVRLSVWSVLQTSIAASLSYFLAVFLLGHEQPFFAPIAAVISLSITLGERGRRTVQLVFGVAIGLLLADLLVLALGTGPARIGLVVLIAMVAAVFFSGRMLTVNQAAISAILVVVLQPPDAGFEPDRFLDALLGGGVALTINHLLPANPERLVERAAREVFSELVSVLEEVAASLRESDPERARRTLLRARRVDDRIRSMTEAISAGYETARLSPTRRRALKHLQLYSAAGNRIELAAINVRVLARGAYNAVLRGDAIPDVLPEAVLDLAEAFKALAEYLEEHEPPEEVKRHALRAAEKATSLLKKRHDLAASVLVGQVRSAAVDILRSAGMDQESSLRALEEAAGRASEV
ncbi:FUSC family protein [Rubrobacter radiotolerans]|nr:FUSC family protein [Rubrobacter radiotolerans]MDX5894665.1 FUSC family protein [Rubrobacter radiotolerans]